MISRVKKIFSEVEGDVDLIVLMNAVAPHIDIGFYYVTGLTSGIFEGCAALLRPGRMEILSSRLEEESAKSAQAKATIFGTGLERDGILKRRLKGAKRIGVNSVELTHKNFTILKRLAKGSRFVDESEAITNARIVKDDGEVEKIRKASAISSKTFEDLIDLMKVGIKEYELAAELIHLLNKKGSSGLAFEP
ncbi:MAG: aminopeptidase P family N-terminal domain-containing protein, partial [Thermoplasmata archaeon]|nr:aminopeptidase P family N-terminal domain-containing protein [Thermoplasmata archaeon]